ncbi:MAG: DUF58 domain-containing protein [Myxococcales bacterium]|nr:DUF58 domain-containing protein [Myxococcales bacterium]
MAGQAAGFAPPRPLWFTAPGCLFQVGGIFLLPFLVAVPAALLFEVSQVLETLPALLAFSAIVLLPVSVLHVIGLLLKNRKELRFWREQGSLTLSRRIDVVHRHAGVVTPRGWVLLFGGSAMTVFALGWKWAELGILAVLALLMFYLLVGWTLFVATFLARTFETGLGRNDRGITRQMMPAVVLSGEAVEEVVRFRRVPVPWGYTLIVDDPNPVRLRTESRYAVGVTATSGEVEARGRLRATPRGMFHLGPARISYQDILGLTLVSVASVATAELKVLPRIMPVVVVDPPRSPMQTPDVVARPHRFATEDHFRFREYLPGDDTRRIHWRLSMRAGRLQVRLPESKETSTEQILLVLDSYLPKGKLLDAAHGGDEILDSLVLAWLGIARELVERGNRVTLVAATTSATDADQIVLESTDARSGTSSRWQDLGARARWQSRYDLLDILEEIGPDSHGVVVTARFTAPPPGATSGKSLTWLMMDPAQALGPPDRHWLGQVIGGNGFFTTLRWIFLLPHPVGSEDNHLWFRLRDAWRIHRRWRARATLRAVARTRAGRTLKELDARGDAVYRIERGPTSIKLVGVRGADAKGPVSGRAA